MIHSVLMESKCICNFLFFFSRELRVHSLGLLLAEAPRDKRGHHRVYLASANSHPTHTKFTQEPGVALPPKQLWWLRPWRTSRVGGFRSRRKADASKRSAVFMRSGTSSWQTEEVPMAPLAGSHRTHNSTHPLLDTNTLLNLTSSQVTHSNRRPGTTTHLLASVSSPMTIQHPDIGLPRALRSAQDPGIPDLVQFNISRGKFLLDTHLLSKRGATTTKGVHQTTLRHTRLPLPPYLNPPILTE